MKTGHLFREEIWIIAGCNGAGKSTAAQALLPSYLGTNQFVNADEIARGLSPFNPESVNILAGRLMLERLRSLMNKGESFAFETTLSTRYYLQLIKEAQLTGYTVRMIFLWLPNVLLAQERVKQRVLEGGHNIPREVIRRRYDRGLRNFFSSYIPLLDTWVFIDNSKGAFELVAENTGVKMQILEQAIWNSLIKEYTN